MQAQVQAQVVSNRSCSRLALQWTTQVSCQAVTALLHTKHSCHISASSGYCAGAGAGKEVMQPPCTAVDYIGDLLSCRCPATPKHSSLGLLHPGTLPAVLLSRIVQTAAMQHAKQPTRRPLGMNMEMEEMEDLGGLRCQQHLVMLLRAAVVNKSWQSAALSAAREMLTRFDLEKSVPEQLLTSSLVHTMIPAVEELIAPRAETLHAKAGLKAFLCHCCALKEFWLGGTGITEAASKQLGVAMADIPSLDLLLCNNFVPAASLPRSLKRLHLNLDDRAMRKAWQLSQQLSSLFLGLQALPHLQRIWLDVSTTEDFVLSARVLSAVQLQQLQRFDLLLSFGKGSYPLLDLSWRGDNARTFELNLSLTRSNATRLLTILQNALRPGDTVYLYLRQPMGADEQAALAAMDLKELSVHKVPLLI